jgi:hypothetical protein
MTVDFNERESSSRVVMKDALTAWNYGIMMHSMRTTVTLDADVERLLKDEAHRRGKSLKIVLNDAVRRALRARPAELPAPLPPVPMGLRAGLDPRKLNQIADDLEAEAFLVSTRRSRHKQ